MNFYKIGKLLGKGAFGKVNLGIHKITGKFVAVKSISKQVMTDQASKTKVMREVSIWEKLRHPSIIQYLHIFVVTFVDCMRLLNLTNIYFMWKRFVLEEIY